MFDDKTLEKMKGYKVENDGYEILLDLVARYSHRYRRESIGAD
jgi:hypothetical protein